MNTKRNSLAVGIAVMVILFTHSVALAIPPTPSGFWGTVSVNGSNVPDNTVITAWINGAQYGSTSTFTYNGNSVYSMEVLGDDPDTAAIIEGGVEGDIIQFHINTLPVQTAVWHSGTNVEHNLSLNPTSVTLSSFDAVTVQDGRIQLRWETVSEVNTQGFNLWRNTSSSGPAEQLNSVLIPSQAPGSSQGFVYTWEDANVVPGQTYWYWLEDIDLNGVTTLHGPVSATAGIPTAVTLNQLGASNQSTNGWLDSLIKFLRGFVSTVFSR